LARRHTIHRLSHYRRAGRFVLRVIKVYWSYWSFSARASVSPIGNQHPVPDFARATIACRREILLSRYYLSSSPYPSSASAGLFNWNRLLSNWLGECVPGRRRPSATWRPRRSQPASFGCRSPPHASRLLSSERWPRRLMQQTDPCWGVQPGSYSFCRKRSLCQTAKTFLSSPARCRRRC
jgi:hypothetical protein